MIFFFKFAESIDPIWLAINFFWRADKTHYDTGPTYEP